MRAGARSVFYIHSRIEDITAFTDHQHSYSLQPDDCNAISMFMTASFVSTTTGSSHADIFKVLKILSNIDTLYKITYNFLTYKINHAIIHQ